MDSNDYREGNIAKGEVDLARLSWLAKQLNDLDSGLPVGGMSLSSDERLHAVRCLVLHHHVCDLSVKKRYFTLDRSFTKMTGAQDLLKLISGRIHLVVHGHEHHPTHFFETESGALIVSAGTTSQWHAEPRQNSFYQLTFFDDNGIQIDEHVWQGKGFVNRQELRGDAQPVRYTLPLFAR